MSGSVTVTGSPITSLPAAVTVASGDEFLLLQAGPSGSVPAFTAKTLAFSVLETAIGGGSGGSDITSVVVDSLSAGDPPTASLSDGVLTLGIPAGAPGTPGAPGQAGVSPTITIGTVTTLAAGVQATASLAAGSTANSYVLDLGIPVGAAGSGGGNLTLATLNKVTSSPATQALAFSGTAGEIAVYDVTLSQATAFSVPTGASSGLQQIILYIRQPASGPTYTPTFPATGGTVLYPAASGSGSAPSINTTNGAVTRMLIETIDGATSVLWGV